MMPRQSVFEMPFQKVYSLLVQKAERKSRTKEEVDQVIAWLTGYPDIDAIGDVSYGDFLTGAPSWNPRSDLITGTICGVRVEEITDPMEKKTRQLDKLVDELAKGKAMEKVCKIALDEITSQRNLPKQRDVFRKAKADEVERAFSLMEKRVHWMDETGIRQWNVTRYLEAYPMSYYEERQSAGSLYVLVRDGSIIGTVVLLEDDERWQDRSAEPALYVHNLATMPGEKGAGKTILLEAEQLARSMGKHYIRLDCAVDNQFLNSYYASFGYQLAGTCEEGLYKGNRLEKEL